MAFGLGRVLYRQFQGVTRTFLPVLWVPLVYTILSSIGLILNFWTTGDMLHDEQFNKVPTVIGGESFDFIVVGGGSSGAIVANRLSKKYRVLLLEAGGEPNFLQNIPGFGVFFVNYPETDWMHKTVPQKFASLNSVNQQSSWSAGKTLGGTGTLNLMVHLRGHKKDFDNWGELLGDPSWSWEGVLPFFKKHEDYEDGADPQYHGYGGDLRIETPDYVGMGPEFVRAGEELGYHHCDLNAPFTEGFDLIKYPIKYGIRQASFNAFLQPIRHSRRNLVIRKFAHVNRVLFKKGNVAYGVEYDKHGATHQAFADKEVIITAGTVNTAKLLMLSGIGPQAHLQEVGIPVLQDLPVGLNLQDHIAAYMGPFFIDKPRALLLERDLTPAAFVQWFTGGRGVLSTTGVHATGIISSSLAKARGEGDWPDIQYFLFGFSVFKSFASAFAHGFGLTLDEQKKFWDHAIDKESFLVAVSGARPYSRGYVKLGGSSPYDAPIIDPRYFSDTENQDLLSVIEGVKILMILTENTTALGEELGTKYTTQLLPGCEHLPFRTDEYWDCYVRRYTVTLHHPVGTASLGKVVDTKLRVLGVENLRVMDCSVEPVLVVTNTQASAMMIAEKGSHMVLEHWKEEEEKAKLRQSQYGPPPKYGPPETQTPKVTFSIPAQKTPEIKYGTPEVKYGVPEQTTPAVTYGIPEQETPVIIYSTPGQKTPEVKYGGPPVNYGALEPRTPEIKYGSPDVKYGTPETKTPQIKYGSPNVKYGAPPEQNNPDSKYGAPSEKPPAVDYGPPLQMLNHFQSTKYGTPSVSGAFPQSNDIKYGAPSPPPPPQESNAPAPIPNIQFEPPPPAPIPNANFFKSSSARGGATPNTKFEPPSASALIPKSQYESRAPAPISITIPIKSTVTQPAKQTNVPQDEEPSSFQLPPKDLITASAPWYQYKSDSSGPAKNKRQVEADLKIQDAASPNSTISLNEISSNLNKFFECNETSSEKTR